MAREEMRKNDRDNVIKQNEYKEIVAAGNNFHRSVGMCRQNRMIRSEAAILIVLYLAHLQPL
jgi:hypothetical protein